MGLVLAAPIAAAAQSTSGSVGGTVRDDQGAAVPGATVTVHSARRNDTQTTVTNEQGDFVILNLLPDTYSLKITMDGFKAMERDEVVLNAADRLSVGSITLELGAMTETITVASRVVEVQSRDADAIVRGRLDRHHRISRSTAAIRCCSRVSRRAWPTRSAPA